MTKAIAAPGGHFDRRVVREAERAADRAIRDFLSPAPAPRGVVVPAPAGAGKTQLVTDAVGRARAQGMRVAVATPTNEQAFALVRRLANSFRGHGSGETVSFLPATK